MQHCHANPQNPNWKPPITRMYAKDIVQRVHPLPKCLECINLPPDVKAKAQANATPTTTAKKVTNAQINEEAKVFESYMQTGEMEFEEAFTTAVESMLGVEVTEATANTPQETATTTIQTLAFTDQDDCHPT